MPMADRTGTVVRASILALAILGIVTIFADPIRELLFAQVPGGSAAASGAAPTAAPIASPALP